MCIHRKHLGEGLSESDKKEIAVDMIEELLKDGYHVSVAVRILENYYCGNINIKQLLVGTKFDITMGNHVVAIVKNKNGEWSEIKQSNFIFLVSNTLAATARDIIAKTHVSLYDAACIILDYLQIPINEENLEIFGKVIKTTLKRYWLWEVYSVDKKELWKSALGKYRPQIKGYIRRGCHIEDIIDKDVMNIIGI